MTRGLGRERCHRAARRDREVRTRDPYLAHVRLEHATRLLARDLLHQLELTVRVQHAGVRSHRVDLDVVDRFSRGDQHVRQAPLRQLDDQVVDGRAVVPLHDVHGQDVGADRSERGRDRPERPRNVRELNPDQEGQGERLPHA